MSSAAFETDLRTACKRCTRCAVCPFAGSLQRQKNHASSSSFSRRFSTASLGLLAPPVSHSSIFLATTVCPTVGALYFDIQMRSRPRRAVVLAERLQRQHSSVVERLSAPTSTACRTPPESWNETVQVFRVPTNGRISCSPFVRIVSRRCTQPILGLIIETCPFGCARANRREHGSAIQLHNPDR